MFNDDDLINPFDPFDEEPEYIKQQMQLLNKIKKYGCDGDWDYHTYELFDKAFMEKEQIMNTYEMLVVPQIKGCKGIDEKTSSLALKIMSLTFTWDLIRAMCTKVQAQKAEIISLKKRVEELQHKADIANNTYANAEVVVTATGVLVDDPIVKTLSNGKRYCVFMVGYSTTINDRQIKRQKTCYIWNDNMIDKAMSELKKGDKIKVSGRWDAVSLTYLQKIQ